MAGEGDSEPRKSFKLLGFLDVQSVPCSRESVLYGSVGSLVVGLGYFLATSFTAGIIWPNKGSGKECLKKRCGTKFCMKAVILIQQENKLAMKEAIHSLL
ncbi:uncharacterized protein LOC115613987 isoform X2 [Strigops habroptila]|uniref:uncharacterized protein LOC115613987 isoform X2 n=1 Tax=Strigops habroptila TaxID=2489341 RepID=UPI0011CEE74E|nr:uncharacterized protein LOC115613987 isoform X2 [Strigops habroptila]